MVKNLMFFTYSATFATLLWVAFLKQYSPLKHIRLGPKPFEGSPFLIIFQYFFKSFIEIHKAHSKYVIISTPFALSG